jgi:hypothetical protein
MPWENDMLSMYVMASASNTHRRHVRYMHELPHDTVKGHRLLD